MRVKSTIQTILGARENWHMKARTLADMVAEASRRHKTTNGELLAKIAQEAGFSVNRTTINHIRAGTYKARPNKDTVRALAWLSGIPEESAYAAAGLPQLGPPFSHQLPPHSDFMSPNQRDVVIRVIQAFTNRRANVELHVARILMSLQLRKMKPLPTDEQTSEQIVAALDAAISMADAFGFGEGVAELENMLTEVWRMSSDTSLLEDRSAWLDNAANALAQKLMQVAYRDH